MRGQPGTRGPVMWPKVLLSSSTNADDADSAKLEAKATFSDPRVLREGKEHERKSPR